MDPHANISRVKKVKLTEAQFGIVAKTLFQTSHGLACSKPEVGLPQRIA